MKLKSLLFFLFSYTLSPIIAQNCVKNIFLRYSYNVDEKKINYGFVTYEQNLSACAGETITLDIAGLDSEIGIIRWMKDGKVVRNEMGNSCKVAESGEYYGEFITNDCTYKTPKLTLSFTTKIEIRIVGPNFTFGNEICEGGQTLIQAYTNSIYNNRLNYQWIKDGKDIANANQNEFLVSKPGTYYVRSSFKECSMQSNPKTIKISDWQQREIRTNYSFINLLDDGGRLNDTIYVCRGNDFLFSQNEGSNYKWFKDGTLTNLIANTSNNWTVKDSGMYYATFTSRGGCFARTKEYHIIFTDSLPKTRIDIDKSADKCGVIKLINSFGNIGVNANELSNGWVNWWYEDIWLSGSNPLRYTVKEISNKVSSGAYVAKFQTGNCQVQSVPFKIEKIIEKPRPKLKISGIEYDNSKKIKLCSGSHFTLNFDKWGAQLQDYKIKYFKNNEEIALPKDAFSNGITINNAGKYHGMYYSDIDKCYVYTDTLEVVVNDITNSKIKVSAVDCDNDKYVLSVEQKDNVVYSWRKEGKILNEGNTTTLNISEKGSYSVVIYDGFCSLESTINITKQDKLQYKQTACEGDTLLVIAPKSDSYSWSGPNNFLSTLQNLKLVGLTSNVNGKYILNRSLHGCKLKDSINVIVNPKPSLILEREEDYCLGKSITLVAKTNPNEEVYYMWESPRSRGKSAIYTPFFTIGNTTRADNGTYKVGVKFKNSNQCVNTKSTFIKLKETDCLSINLEYPKKTPCLGEKVELPFKLEGNFASDETFDLYRLDSAGVKVKLASGLQSPIHYTVNSSITLILISSKQKIQSNVIGIYPFSPSFQLKYNSTSACEGYTIPIRALYSGVPFDKIQWYLDNNEIPNATQDSIEASKSGVYSVKIEQKGCVSSNSNTPKVRVTIGRIEPYSIYHTKELAVCDGYKVALDATSSNLKDIRYQWQINGVDIPNATSAKYLATTEGLYSLKTIQGSCEAISDVRKIFIGKLNKPNLVSYPFSIERSTISVCQGLETELRTFNYVEYTSQGAVGIDNVKFQWQKDGIDIEKATQVNFKTNQQGVFRLKITQGDCIAFSDEITINSQRPNQLVLYTSSQSACEGETVEITSYSKRESLYQHDIKNTLTIKLYKNSQFIQDIDFGETIKVNEGGRYFGVASFLIPDSKEVCTVFSDTTDVKIGGKIINYKITDDNKISTCLDSLLIYGKNYDPQIKKKNQWKFNSENLPSDTLINLIARKSGVYQLESKTPNCTYLSEPLQVEFGKIEVGIDRLQYPYCSYNENYIFSRINSFYDYFNPSSILNYEWLLDGRVIGKTHKLQIEKSGNYILNVRHGNCTATSSLKMDVINISKVIVPTQDSIFICPNGLANLEASTADKYTWLLDNQVLANNRTQTIKASKAGNYRVWLEKEGCVEMSNVAKVFNKIIPPTAVISGGKDINFGDSTQIKVDFTSSAPWTFKMTNNQEFTTERNPFQFSVKPQQTTVYELASVKNNCGEGTVSGKAEVKIIILGNEEIAGAKVSLYPIPAQSNCRLSVETVFPERLQWQLYTADGKLISKTESQKLSNNYQESLNLQELSNGTYLLKIIIGNKILTRKIIKQD